MPAKKTPANSEPWRNDPLYIKARVCVEEAKAKNAAARSQEADFEKAVEDRLEIARSEWLHLANTERKSADVSRSMLSDARSAQRDAENAREIAKLEAQMTRESKHYWGFCGLVLGAGIAAMLGGLPAMIERKALDDIRRDLDRMVPSWRLIYHDDIQAAAEDCGLWPEDADWDDADEFLAPLDLGEDAAWQRMEDDDDA